MMRTTTTDRVFHPIPCPLTPCKRKGDQTRPFRTLAALLAHVRETHGCPEGCEADMPPWLAHQLVRCDVCHMLFQGEDGVSVHKGKSACGYAQDLDDAGMEKEEEIAGTQCQ